MLMSLRAEAGLSPMNMLLEVGRRMSESTPVNSWPEADLSDRQKGLKLNVYMKVASNIYI
jgi:hypothetical protein